MFCVQILPWQLSPLKAGTIRIFFIVWSKFNAGMGSIPCGVTIVFLMNYFIIQSLIWAPQNSNISSWDRQYLLIISKWDKFYITWTSLNWISFVILSNLCVLSLQITPKIKMTPKIKTKTLFFGYSFPFEGFHVNHCMRLYISLEPGSQVPMNIPPSMYDPHLHTQYTINRQFILSSPP